MFKWTAQAHATACCIYKKKSQLMCDRKIVKATKNDSQRNEYRPS